VNALADISAWLEPISIEATTFSDSFMVSKGLVALHVHIVEFWTKAYSVYSSSRSTKFFGTFKATWIDYDEEFILLKERMEGDLKLFLASANAEHHRHFAQFNKSFDQSKSQTWSRTNIELRKISDVRRPSSTNPQRCRPLASSRRRSSLRHRFLPDGTLCRK
jgi:hypothetical protein